MMICESTANSILSPNTVLTLKDVVENSIDAFEQHCRRLISKVSFSETEKKLSWRVRSIVVVRDVAAPLLSTAGKQKWFFHLSSIEQRKLEPK